MKISANWWYTLWYKGLPMLERLHRRLPQASLFACSVGECDDSFGFVLYAGGQLQRRVVVNDPDFDRKKRIVAVDFGQPISGEDEELKNGDPRAYVLFLATQLGIRFNHKHANTRCYAVPGA